MLVNLNDNITLVPLTKSQFEFSIGLWIIAELTFREKQKFTILILFSKMNTTFILEALNIMDINKN